MNKENIKFLKNILIVLISIILIISMINNLAIASTVKDAKNLWDLYNCTQDKEGWYSYEPQEVIGNEILDQNINYVGLDGVYCIDNHTGHTNTAQYRIVNVIDINNNTTANTVKIYSEEHPEGVEYSFSNPNIKPFLMIAYLAEKGLNDSLTRIILNNTYNAQMKEVGLSKFVNAAGYGVQGHPILDEAYAFADDLSKQSALETANLSITMTEEEKDNITVITDNGKTYIGPYKVNLTGGCKVGEITLTNKDGEKIKADGIVDSEFKNTDSIENIVDAKEFYIVLNQEIDEIKSIDIAAKENVTSIKARLLITSAGIAQNMIFYNSEMTKEPINTTLEVPKFGKLQILKKDEYPDSNVNLKDIGFMIWSTNKNAYIIENNGKIEYVNFETAKKNEFKTDNEGKTKVIDNLPLGSYKIYETSIPENLQEIYDLPETKLQDKDGKEVTTKAKFVKEEQIKSGQTVNTTKINKRDFANFYIEKIDKATGTPLNGIQFKLYKVNVTDKEGKVSEKGGWVAFDAENKVTSAKESFENATPLTTGFSSIPGRTQTITRLPVGTYRVFESSLGEHEDIYEIGTTRIEGKVVEGHFIDIKEVKPDETGVAHFGEENPQDYIKISGNVWEDAINGKQEKIPNYQLDETDNRVNGIEVKLVNKESGEVIQTTKTANGGKYTFEKVKIEELGNYIVEFTYDGITYQSINNNYTTNQEISEELTSKAGETRDDRKALNNTFKQITGEGQKVNYNNKEITITYSKEKDDKGNITVTSNNVCDRNKGLNALEKIVNLSKLGDFTINSSTDKGYLLSKYAELQGTEKKNIVTEIKNINLGLLVREQPDISLVKDVTTADVSINGKSYTYNYEKRLRTGEVPTAVGVVFEIKSEEGIEYKTPLYRADAAYTNADKSKELQVYITYKIALSNNSENLYTTVNSLTETYSKELEFTKLTVKDKEITNIEEKQEGNYKTYIFDDLNLRLEPKNSDYVYVTFKLPKAGFFNMKGQEFYQDKQFENFAEISSYTIYSDKFDTLYAGFDTNSIPNNLDPSKYIETDEDDSDKAPGLKIEDAGQRTISGIVFEDSDKDENDRERIGDGKYTDGENKIANVKTRLLDSEGNEVQVYDMDKKQFVNQDSTTGENGEYTISGFIPGNYTVRYIWGEGAQTKVMDGKDTAVTVDSYKSTIWTDESKKEKDNEKWYLQNDPRYSDAQDDYDMRLKFDGNDKSLLQILNSSVDDISTIENKAVMNSNTQGIEVGIEAKDYEEVLVDDQPIYKFEITNVDLGLIERPRQTMSIEKTVDSMRLVTAQKQVILEAQINDAGEWEIQTGIVTGGPEYEYIRGETDSDIIDSGTTAYIGYKIRIKNNSDKEYDSKDYYLYGIPDESKQVALRATGIYDYLSGLDADVESNVNWKILEQGSEETKKETIMEKVVENMSSSSSSSIYSTFNAETGETLIVQEIVGEETKETINEFAEEMQTTQKDFRSIINADKIIAKFTDNGNSYVELKPGEVKEVKYYGEKTLSSEKDIDFNNEVEIEDIQKTTKTGRSVELEHSNFYDRSEEIIITPPTGENRDYTMIIIISVAAIAILGAGIIIIKKTVLKK